MFGYFKHIRVYGGCLGIKRVKGRIKYEKS